MNNTKPFLPPLVMLAGATLVYGWWNPTFIPFAFGAFLMVYLGRAGWRKGNRGGVWAGGFLACIVLLLTAVGSFNYVVDPLWCFSHANGWNGRQVGFDERQLKTNLVTFRDFPYSSLIIGSSRTTYINQNDFQGMKAFNFAVSSMFPDEYIKFVRYAKKKRGRDFETLFVGLDFFGTNAGLKRTEERPEYYFAAAGSAFYRYKMLYSLNAVRFALGNVRQARKRDTATYDRGNVATPVELSRPERDYVDAYQLQWFRLLGYGKRYRYDDRLKESLEELVQDNPHTRFVVFTTPVSKPLFCLMVKQGRFADYERWLREVVGVFGSVYHFMDLNSVTTDYRKTFADVHHVRPETGMLIARRLTGVRPAEIPGDFGKVLTRENVEPYLETIREQTALCR